MLGFYFHIPYCVKKCPYCDFNSYAESSFPEERYTAALVRELETYTNSAPWSGRRCQSIFFGGGTPSLFSAKSIELLLRAVGRCVSVAEDCEVTLETNPGTVYEQLSLEKLRGFLAAGVNRISFGSQSFSAEKLKFLGRIHSGDDTKRAVENVRCAGFQNFNLDLICGTAVDTLSVWQSDLDIALALEPKHISAYTLTIEPGTEFHRQERRGNLQTADEDAVAEMYEYTQEKLTRAGFLQYEISNFAPAGFECRHNLLYWRAGDYLGLGAGAHSHSATETKRWSNIPGPTHYMQRIEETGRAEQRAEQLDIVQQELEYLFLHLRTARGLSDSDYYKRFNYKLLSRFEKEIETLKTEGLLLLENDTLSLSRKGFLFSDHVFNTFAASAAI